MRDALYLVRAASPKSMTNFGRSLGKCDLLLHACATNQARCGCGRTTVRG
jgi:hypothetical protein